MGKETKEEIPLEYRTIEPYKKDSTRFGIFVALSVCTGLLYAIACWWYPVLFTRTARRRCLRPYDADIILAQDPDGLWWECPVVRVGAYEDAITYFEFRKQKHIVDEDGRIHIESSELDMSCTFKTINDTMKKGLAFEEQRKRYERYGRNLIEVPIPPVWKLLVEKMLHPFYVFQMFSIILWFVELYTIFSAVLLIMSVGSVSWEIWTQRKNGLRLRELAHELHKTEVLRDGVKQDVDSVDLVPGDVIFISNDFQVTCDLVLLSGECIVDESSLTGESIPLVKQALPCLERPEDTYSPERNKTSTLMCGSKVLIAKAVGGQEPMGLVTRTAFATSKGQLFRSILFPKPIKFKMDNDSYKFLLIMGLVALGSFINSMIQQLEDGGTAADVVMSSFDLVTIAVPPALPLVLTVGIGFALERLNKNNIFCVEPKRINLAGRIDCYCFDKTGTLTEDQLRFDGVCTVPEPGPTTASSAPVLQQRTVEDAIKTSVPLRMLMAACHGVVRVAGQNVGHAVDMSMFSATGWSLVDPQSERLKNVISVVRSPDHQQLHVLRRFDFDPRVQRSSVLVSDPSASSFRVLVKGSAENIKAVCRPHTVPKDLEKVVAQYSHQGVYVIACAYKDIPALPIEEVAAYRREYAEGDLLFCGLMLFLNPLKPESIGVLRELEDANVRCLMLTGDNTFTAVSVAKQAGMLDKTSKVYIIDVVDGNVVALDEETSKPYPLSEVIADANSSGGVEFAITGKGVARVSEEPETWDWTVRNVKIFGRVLPDHKSLIVTGLIERGWYVGMCGDGTNDCGALKAAHVGLALSEADASVVAPFTSKAKLISDVPLLLREGRCALTTSFAAFKYMMMYPIIQLMMALRLYSIGATLGQWQYTYDDLILVVPISSLMCRTLPARVLSAIKPSSTLFSFDVMASVIGQVIIQMLFLLGSNLALENQSWYCKLTSDASSGCLNLRSTSFDGLGQSIQCYENTVSWAFGHFQYIIVGLAFSLSTTFRRPFYTNGWFVVGLIATSLLTSLVLLLPVVPMERFFDLMTTAEENYSMSFRWALFFLMLLNAAVSLIYESLIVLIDKRRRMARLRRKVAPSVRAEFHHSDTVELKADLLQTASRSS